MLLKEKGLSLVKLYFTGNFNITFLFIQNLLKIWTLLVMFEGCKACGPEKAENPNIYWPQPGGNKFEVDCLEERPDKDTYLKWEESTLVWWG